MTRPDPFQEQRDREAAVKPAFDAHRHFLEFGGRYRTALGRRLGEAFDAISGWRMATNQRHYFGDEDKIALAARVTATVTADQIQAAAGPDQDPATIAWVVAGLRCPVQPFCPGCIACQTVTSPLRPAASIRASRW